MLTPLFNCGQQELYAVCRLVWEAVTDNLADFTGFKAKYVAAFITAREAARPQGLFGERIIERI